MFVNEYGNTVVSQDELIVCIASFAVVVIISVVETWMLLALRHDLPEGLWGTFKLKWQLFGHKDSHFNLHNESDSSDGASSFTDNPLREDPVAKHNEVGFDKDQPVKLTISGTSKVTPELSRSLSRNDPKKSGCRTPNRQGTRRFSGSTRGSLSPKVPENSWEVDMHKLRMRYVIGRGNFGEVWLGTWLGSPVAVKTILPEVQKKERLVKRFLGEINMMSRLHHPNVTMFLGACTKSPNLCMVLEYCVHGSLHHFLKNEHRHKIRITMGLVYRFALDIARGVYYLHKKQSIVQRDLKARNILVDASLNAKVADFGLSRVLDIHDTNQLTACGTPAWTAPEIVKMEKYTDKVDVYSFAIILWELLTREEPYGGRKGVQIAYAAAQQGLRPTIPEFCPPEYAELMQQCWAANPDDRPNFGYILKVLFQLKKQSDQAAADMLKHKSNGRTKHQTRRISRLQKNNDLTRRQKHTIQDTNQVQPKTKEEEKKISAVVPEPTLKKDKPSDQHRSNKRHTSLHLTRRRSSSLPGMPQSTKEFAQRQRHALGMHDATGATTTTAVTRATTIATTSNVDRKMETNEFSSSETEPTSMILHDQTANHETQFVRGLRDANHNVSSTMTHSEQTEQTDNIVQMTNNPSGQTLSPDNTKQEKPSHLTTQDMNSQSAKQETYSQSTKQDTHFRTAPQGIHSHGTQQETRPFKAKLVRHQNHSQSLSDSNSDVNNVKKISEHHIQNPMDVVISGSEHATKSSRQHASFSQQHASSSQQHASSFQPHSSTSQQHSSSSFQQHTSPLQHSPIIHYSDSKPSDSGTQTVSQSQTQDLSTSTLVIPCSPALRSTSYGHVHNQQTSGQVSVTDNIAVPVIVSDTSYLSATGMLSASMSSSFPSSGFRYEQSSTDQTFTNQRQFFYNSSAVTSFNTTCSVEEDDGHQQNATTRKTCRQIARQHFAPLPTRIISPKGSVTSTTSVLADDIPDDFSVTSPLQALQRSELGGQSPFISSKYHNGARITLNGALSSFDTSESESMDPTHRSPFLQNGQLILAAAAATAESNMKPRRTNSTFDDGQSIDAVTVIPPRHRRVSNDTNLLSPDVTDRESSSGFDIPSLGRDWTAAESPRELWPTDQHPILRNHSTKSTFGTMKDNKFKNGIHTNAIFSEDTECMSDSMASNLLPGILQQNVPHIPTSFQDIPNGTISITSPIRHDNSSGYTQPMRDTVLGHKDHLQTVSAATSGITRIAEVDRSTTTNPTPARFSMSSRSSCDHTISQNNSPQQEKSIQKVQESSRHATSVAKTFTRCTYSKNTTHVTSFEQSNVSKQLPTTMSTNLSMASNNAQRTDNDANSTQTHTNNDTERNSSSTTNQAKSSNTNQTKSSNTDKANLSNTNHTKSSNTNQTKSSSTNQTILSSTNQTKSSSTNLTKSSSINQSQAKSSASSPTTHISSQEEILHPLNDFTAISVQSSTMATGAGKNYVASPFSSSISSSQSASVPENTYLPNQPQANFHQASTRSSNTLSTSATMKSMSRNQSSYDEENTVQEHVQRAVDLGVVNVMRSGAPYMRWDGTVESDDERENSPSTSPVESLYNETIRKHTFLNRNHSEQDTTDHVNKRRSFHSKASRRSPVDPTQSDVDFPQVP